MDSPVSTCLDDLNDRTARQDRIFACLAESKEKYVSYETLSLRTYVSRSTVIKDVRELKADLKDRFGSDLSIDGIPRKGITLVGDELSIRRYILGSESAFMAWSGEMTRVLRDLSDGYTEFLVSKLTDAFYLDAEKAKLLRHVIALTEARVREGRNLEEPISQFTNFFSEDALIMELLRHIEKVLNKRLGEVDAEFVALACNLGTRHCPISARPELDHFLLDLTDRVSNTYEFYIDREFLSQEMAEHLAFMVNRVVFDVSPDVVMGSDIERSYPFAYQIACDATDELSRRLNRRIAQEEAMLLAVYFQIAIEKKFGSERKFAVVGLTSEAVRRMVHDRVRTMFTQGCHFMEVDEGEVSDLEPKQVSVIIASRPLSVSSHIPVISVPDVFDEAAMTGAVDCGDRRLLLASDCLSYGSEVLPCRQIPSFEQALANTLERANLRMHLDDDFVARVLSADVTSYSYGSSYLPHAVLMGSQCYMLEISLYLAETGQSMAIALLGIPNELPEGSEHLVVRLYDFIFDLFHQLSVAGGMTNKDACYFIDYLRGDS